MLGLWGCRLCLMGCEGVWRPEVGWQIFLKRDVYRRLLGDRRMAAWCPCCRGVRWRIDLDLRPGSVTALVRVRCD